MIQIRASGAERPADRAVCRTGAFTLLELLISTAISSLILGALFTAAATMQRSFVANDDYATSKCDQMRLTDYLAMDLRRALTVTPGTGSTVVTITIPDFYGGGMPVISGTTVNYGNPSTPVTVSYTKAGSSIFRQENAGAKTEIANNVNGFVVTIQDLDKVVKTQITFAPKYRFLQTADARTATSVYNTTLLRNTRRDRG